MKFNDYERKYEYVFIPKEGWTPEQLEKDVVIGDGKIQLETFYKQIRDTYKQFEDSAFDWLVKTTWLHSHFSFRGLKVIYGEKNPGFLLSYSYSKLMRVRVGFDYTFFGNDNFLRHIKSYLKDLFPDLPERNPFVKKIKYPFKFMNLECLHLVYRMPERMELLKTGEAKKMTLEQFMDYIVNYINCYNEEHGKTYILFTGSDKNERGFSKQKFVKII